MYMIYVKKIFSSAVNGIVRNEDPGRGTPGPRTQDPEPKLPGRMTQGPKTWDPGTLNFFI